MFVLNKHVACHVYIHIRIYPDILWIMRISGYYPDIRRIIRISKILYPSNPDIRISVGYPFLTDNGYKLYVRYIDSICDLMNNDLQIPDISYVRKMFQNVVVSEHSFCPENVIVRNFDNLFL